MKFLQNKIIIGAACILAAGIFAFGVLPGMYKGKGGTEKIVKVNSTINAGTKIEEEMLVETEVGSFGLPENAVRKKEDAVGKYTKSDITPDDLIIKSKLSDYAANEKLDSILAEGKKLVTITLPSIAASVGNNIQTGDIISLICYIDNKPVIYDELKNLEVYSVENDNAKNIEETSAEDDEKDKIAETLTLAVNDVQAEKLVAAEYSGKIHAVFERRGG